MNTNRRTGQRGVLGLAVAAAAVLAIALAAPAAAGRNGTNVIRGVQLAYGTCGDGTGYLMTGPLQGCWWIDTFVVHRPEDTDKSHYMATGTEHFTGWYGSLYGTFTTTYRFTAKTDGPWPTSAEVHGRCHHPITGGTGDFAGLTGELSFHDVLDGPAPTYPYWGSFHLAKGVSSTAGTTSATRAAAATDSAGTTC